MTINRTLMIGLLAGAGVLAFAKANAQARVQVIHNSADAAAEVVDVYINGEMAIDDFAFRTATPFLDLPSGVDLEVGIAPGNSMGAGDIIPGLTETYNLVDGEAYVLVANGIVSPTGYTPATPFDIYPTAGQETSPAGTSSVLVFHGSTDAPTVQVAETAVLGGAVIVSDLSYGDFAGYLEVPTADFVLQVQLPDGTPVVSYAAPLATLGLHGAAMVVVASGFLNPANNSNGAGFGLWVALPTGGDLVELPLVQQPTGTARVQVIHNSADAAAAVVDVYINGEIAIDDFAFRTATPFIDLPSGVDLEVGIAPGNSTGAGDIIPGLTETYNLMDGEAYVLVANGIVSPTGYTPATPFEIYVTNGALESSPAGTSSVLVFHGSTDAPTVQVAETAVLGGAVIVSDLSYGDFAGYLEVPTADFVLQVQLPDGTPVVSYAAPLATLGLDGAAMVVVASGFLNPANNSNGAGFGLWVALPTGGDLVELPLVQQPTGTARVQVIHNSADAAAAVVDVYINGEIAIDDFAFRSATPFIDLPSGVDLEVGIAPGNSTGAGDIIPGLTETYNLADGEAYVLVANGIVSPTGYTPATPFDIYVTNGALESSPAGTSSVLVFHGSTDAPTVQVAETAVLGGAVLVSDLSYGDFAGYLEVPTQDYVLQVQLTDGTPVVSYAAPLSSLNLDGAALVVVASGFLNPANNSNGPGFGLWVALPTGGDLIPLPLFTGIGEDDVLGNVSVFPNPAGESFFVDLNATTTTQATITLTDLGGRIVRELSNTTLAAGESRLVLPVADLANGSYLLSIRTAEGRSSRPVQIAR